MRHLRLTSVRLDEELIDAMMRLRERDGIQASEQVRRGLVRSAAPAVEGT